MIAPTPPSPGRSRLLRAFGQTTEGAVYASTLMVVARGLVAWIFWGDWWEQHQAWLRLAGFGTIWCCVSALAMALVTVMAGPGASPGRRAGAGVVAGLTCLTILRGLFGSGAQDDMDLPLGNTLAFVGHISILSILVPRGAFATALASAVVVGMIHGLTQGTARAVLAGVVEGSVLGWTVGRVALFPEGLLLPAGGPVRRALERGLGLVALVGGLALGMEWVWAIDHVARLERELEPTLVQLRVRAPEQSRARARRTVDLATSLALLRSWARHHVKHRLAGSGPYQGLAGPGQARHRLQVFSGLARHLALGLAGQGTPTASPSVRRILGLLSSSDLDLATEIDDRKPGCLKLLVFRRGVPLLAATLAGPDDTETWPGLLKANQESVQLVGPDQTRISRGESGRLHSRGPWICEVSGPNLALRQRAFMALVEGKWQGDDDLFRPSDLTPADLVDPGPVSLATVLGSEAAALRAQQVVMEWRRQGLRPLVGDLHCHAGETVGGSVAAPGVVRAGLGLFSHFHALTEHLAPGGNAAVLESLRRASPPPGIFFVPGQEVLMGRGHLTILGGRSWVACPWFEYAGPVADMVRAGRSTGDRVILAHPFYPKTPARPYKWALVENWRSLGVVACEDGADAPTGFPGCLEDAPALVGGSDAHSCRFGGRARTLVMARSATLEGLTEALDSGRTLALRPDQPGLGRGSEAMVALLWQMLVDPAFPDPHRDWPAAWLARWDPR